MYQRKQTVRKWKSFALFQSTRSQRFYVSTHTDIHLYVLRSLVDYLIKYINISVSGEVICWHY